MTYPIKRKKSGSSLIASANFKTFDKHYRQKVKVTDPLLLDHVLDLLHGRVVGISGKVEEHTQRSDGSTPASIAV